LPYGSARIDNEFHQNAPLAPDRMFVIGLKRPSGDGHIAADILEHEAERVAAEIRAVGSEATSAKINVTSEPEWVALIRKAVSAYGRLDILVNNVGISGSSSASLTGSKIGLGNWTPSYTGHIAKIGSGGGVSVAADGHVRPVPEGRHRVLLHGSVPDVTPMGLWADYR
jgi:NAD(P)-dependent dehydrogenase (short-subunit alcohol dehydrogenase family)